MPRTIRFLNNTHVIVAPDDGPLLALYTSRGWTDVRMLRINDQVATVSEYLTVSHIISREYSTEVPTEPPINEHLQRLLNDETGSIITNEPLLNSELRGLVDDDIGDPEPTPLVVGGQIASVAMGALRVTEIDHEEGLVSFECGTRLPFDRLRAFRHIDGRVIEHPRRNSEVREVVPMLARTIPQEMVVYHIPEPGMYKFPDGHIQECVNEDCYVLTEGVSYSVRNGSLLRREFTVTPMTEAPTKPAPETSTSWSRLLHDEEYRCRG